MNIGIAEMDKAVGHLNVKSKQSSHRPFLPIDCDHRMAQKHQAAAFSIDQFAFAGQSADILKQSFVIAQLFCIKLRIATTEVHSIKLVWQLRAVEWTELDQFRTQLP